METIETFEISFRYAMKGFALGAQQILNSSLAIHHSKSENHCFKLEPKMRIELTTYALRVLLRCNQVETRTLVDSQYSGYKDS